MTASHPLDTAAAPAAAPARRTGRAARTAARLAAAAALAGAALLAPGAVGAAHAADSAPCTYEYNNLYRCPMWGTDVNFHTEPRQDAPVGGWSPDSGYILVSCQVRGGQATYGSYWHTWWVKAPATGMAPDLYMSEIFLKGGGNDEPDAGLPVC